MVIQIKSLLLNNTQEELFENLLDFLDGKTTVYHGTSPENKINIQQNGLNGKYTGDKNSATEILRSVNPDAYNASKDKVFTTNSRWMAAKYAASHHNGERITGLSDTSDILKTFPRTIHSYVTGKGIVKMRLPKEFVSKSEVLNPELKSLLDKNLHSSTIQNNSDMVRNYIVPNIGLKSFGNDRVFKNDIDTKYISGSNNYEKINLKNIKNNIFNKRTEYSKIKSNALRGSNKSTRIGRSNAKKVNLVSNGLKALGSGIIGYNLLKDEPTKVDQFIDTIIDK